MANAGVFTGEHGAGVNYSFLDAQAAIYGAGQLGLKFNGPAGRNVGAYQNLDYTAQTQYGMTHAQTQQQLSTALAYGIDMNQYMRGIGAERNLAKNSTMSTSYSDSAYQIGAATAAGLGATGTSAINMGVQAVKFGMNSTIAQAAGMTGQELLGTQIGMAYFAQAAGIPYMDIYSASQKMSASKFASTERTAMLNLLNQIGINPNIIKKKSDLYPYAIKLNMILPQLGVTDINTPQQAVEWAWLMLHPGGGTDTVNVSTGTTSTNAHVAGMPQGPKQGASPNPTVSSNVGTTSSMDTIQSLASAYGSNPMSTGTLATGTGAQGSGNVAVQISMNPNVLNILTAAIQQAGGSTTSPSARPQQK